MNEDDSAPVIHVEVTASSTDRSTASRSCRIETTWNLEDAVESFLGEMSAENAMPMNSGLEDEILVTAALADRGFPSMHFDHRLLNRLAASGMSLRIQTGPRGLMLGTSD